MTDSCETPAEQPPHRHGGAESSQELLRLGGMFCLGTSGFLALKRIDASFIMAQMPREVLAALRLSTQRRSAG